MPKKLQWNNNYNNNANNNDDGKRLYSTFSTWHEVLYDDKK